MSAKNSIQARLGGVGLPTTIHQDNEIVTNLSDFVVVKEHMGDTIVVNNHGVRTFPVTLLADGGVHLGFDLTHGGR